MARKRTSRRQAMVFLAAPGQPPTVVAELVSKARAPVTVVVLRGTKPGDAFRAIDQVHAALHSFGGHLTATGGLWTRLFELEAAVGQSARVDVRAFPVRRAAETGPSFSVMRHPSKPLRKALKSAERTGYSRSSEPGWKVATIVVTRGTWPPRKRLGRAKK